MLPSAASLKTLTIVAASIPALTPTVQHSAMTRSSVKLAELCMILAIDPVPMPPVWITRLAIASSRGRARTTARRPPPANDRQIARLAPLHPAADWGIAHPPARVGEQRVNPPHQLGP